MLIAFGGVKAQIVLVDFAVFVRVLVYYLFLFVPQTFKYLYFCHPLTFPSSRFSPLTFVSMTFSFFLAYTSGCTIDIPMPAPWIHD